jgi:hypothetical protein
MMPNPASSTALVSNAVPYDIDKNVRRHLEFMQRTLDLLTHVVAPVSQTTATTLRDAQDGEKGWTVVEVLCHLRDFDSIFRARVEMMRDQENPTLPAYDHEQLAHDGQYNSQLLTDVLAELRHSRQATIAVFAQLSNEQWSRAGIHPERGHFTMVDAAMQVGMHEVIHLEQITRILFQNE